MTTPFRNTPFNGLTRRSKRSDYAALCLAGQAELLLLSIPGLLPGNEAFPSRALHGIRSSPLTGRKVCYQLNLSPYVPLEVQSRFDTLGAHAITGGLLNKEEHYRSHLLSLAGIGASVLLAIFLIISVRGTHRSLLVPVVFLVFIILCARYFGMLAGVVASVLASVLFAVFLYEPYGSFRVKDHQALWNTGLLLFAGIALSYANSGGEEDEPKTPKNL